MEKLKINNQFKYQELYVTINIYLPTKKKIIVYGKLVLQIQTISRSLVYSAFTEQSFSTTQGWETSITQSSLSFSQCEGSSLLGKFGSSQWIMKVIDLPPHHTVYIKFLIWRLGNWNNEKFTMLYDETIGYQDTYTQNGIKSCNGRTATDLEIEILFPHEFQSILIQIKAQLGGTINLKSWGIRNFLIEVEECIPGCKQCRQSDQRWECLQWNLVHSTINSIQLQQLNFDGWIIQETSNQFQQSNLSPIPIFGGTDIIGYDCEIFVNFDLPIHNIIKIQFRLAYINFQDNENFYLKIDQQEKFHDNHNLLNTFSLDSNPTISYNFQIQELILEHKSNQIEIIFSKDTLNQGALGINDFMLFVKTQGYCGDGFQSQEEECDDNNIYPFDGCFNCQYSCIENCLFCHQGICLECKEDYYLQELEQKCVYIQQIQFNEVTQINICKRCQDTCQNQCNYCVKGECQCENDQTQTSDQSCDDYRQRNAFSLALLNFQEYKCHACEFDCAAFCTECIYGYCFSCQPKFYLINYECLPICGDGYIVDYEECDDQNMIPYDGCYDCKYQCSQNCKKCQKGICQECQNGFLLINQFCQILCDNQLGCNQLSTLQQCGNGILEGNEQCDDANSIDFDGCSQTCVINYDYVCKTYLYLHSECTYQKWPKILASFLFQSMNAQNVLLYFSQQVKIQERLNNQQIINSILVDINSNIYMININDDLGVKEELSNAQYVLKISYFSSLDEPPLLKVQFNQNLYNQDDISLNDNQIILKLQKPQYIDDQNYKISQTTKNVNKYLIYSMGGLALYNLFEGNLVLFSTLLDILQQQSYLKYINTDIPLNLQIYFESSNLISLQTFLDSLKFEELLNLIFPQNFQECKDKFQLYELNADIFTNLQTQISQIIIMFFSFSFSKLIVSLINLLQDRHYEKIGSMITKIILLIKKSCQGSLILLQKQGLQIFLESNFYDLVFNSLLQIKYGDRSHSYLTWPMLTSCIIIIGCVVHFLLYNKNTFSSIHYLEKLLFLFFLIYFQEAQQIQTLLLSLINLVFLIQIIKYIKKISSHDSIFLIINISSFFVFTFTSFLYWNEQIMLNHDYQKKIIYGWVHIGIFLFVLVYCIGQQIIQKLDCLINYIRKNSKTVSNNANPWPLVKITTKT